MVLFLVPTSQVSSQALLRFQSEGSASLHARCDFRLQGPAEALTIFSASGCAAARCAVLRVRRRRGAGSGRAKLGMAVSSTVEPAEGTASDVGEGPASEVEGDFQIEEFEEELPPPPPPFDPTQQVGVTAPLGFFDPLGFCPPGDEANFRSNRAAEIKHGRVAMLASVGFVVQHYIRFPFGGLWEAPSGLGATQIIPSLWFWCLLIIACGVVELLFWKEQPGREPGDFGDTLKLGMYDTDMRNRELNNGRAAMFTTLGIIVAELATGKDAVQQLGL